MTMLANAGILLLGAFLAMPVTRQTTTAAEDRHSPLVAPPASSLPVVAEHRYRMAARVRPFLLFWIGRDNVGGGRVVWRRGDADTVAYELLIGSDPDRAPRRINRWGYLIEQVHGTHGTVLGVMTESDEQSLEEAKARLSPDRGEGTHLFKAIHAIVTADEARAGVRTVRVPHSFTYRDAPVVLDLVTNELARASVRRVRMPEGARPGFLGALAELIHRNVAAQRRSAGSTSRDPISIPFVYNARLYDLTLRDAEFLREAQFGGRRFARVVRGEFESRNRTTGDTTRFELVYGTDAALAEVPVHVVYRPRWWFEVQLTLDEDTRF